MFTSLPIGLFLSDQAEIWYTYASNVSCLETSKSSRRFVALNRFYANFYELRQIYSHFSGKTENRFSTNLCKWRLVFKMFFDQDLDFSIFYAFTHCLVWACLRWLVAQRGLLMFASLPICLFSTVQAELKAAFKLALEAFVYRIAASTVKIRQIGSDAIGSDANIRSPRRTTLYFVHTNFVRSMYIVHTALIKNLRSKCCPNIFW